MAENLPCFLLNVRKWLCSDTVRRLHRAGGRGVNAYIFLLCEAWLQTPQGTLPNDEDLLIEMARITPKEWAEVWPILEPKFMSDGNGRIYNEELLAEAKGTQMKRYAGQSGWSEKRRKSQASRARKLKP